MTKLEQWRARVVEQASSGLSMEEYCRRNGLRSSTFWNWKARFKKSAAAEQFVVVGGTDEVELQHPSGVIIKASVTQAVKILETLACAR